MWKSNFSLKTSIKVTKSVVVTEEGWIEHTLDDRSINVLTS